MLLMLVTTRLQMKGDGNLAAGGEGRRGEKRGEEGIAGEGTVWDGVR